MSEPPIACRSPEFESGDRPKRSESGPSDRQITPIARNEGSLKQWSAIEPKTSLASQQWEVGDRGDRPSATGLKHSAGGDHQAITGVARA